jgi:hypothetical protein
MDLQDLVTVYTVSNAPQAEIIKNFLNSEGIECFLGGINQAGDAGLIGLEINIQVPVADADRARKLILSHEARHKAHGHV